MMHDYPPVGSPILAIAKHAVKGGELRPEEIKLLATIVKTILTKGEKPETDD